MGFSQNQICDLISCSRKWLGDFEKGKIDPDVAGYGRVTSLEAIYGEPAHVLVQLMEPDDAIDRDRGGNIDVTTQE